MLLGVVPVVLLLAEALVFAFVWAPVLLLEVVPLVLLDVVPVLVLLPVEALFLVFVWESVSISLASVVSVVFSWRCTTGTAEKPEG